MSRIDHNIDYHGAVANRARHPDKSRRSVATDVPRAPDGYDPRAFPPFAVTVDVVILAVTDRRLEVLLVERAADPYAGSWALPGGFKRTDETLDRAAKRELFEETGVKARHLRQFRAYGDPGRDPRTDVVTVAHLAAVRTVGTPKGGSDARRARMFSAAEVISGRLRLAFDHRRIVADAVEVARVELETTSLATAFIGPDFTLTELREVYEAVWETTFDPANFRRAMLSKPGFVEATGALSSPGPEGGRPPELYRAPRGWPDGSPIRRPKPKAPRGG